MEFPLDSAIYLAHDKANKEKLPMTVFKNQFSGGWWFTHSLAALLHYSDLHMTALPSNYFH